eukprot:358740-Prorocentrum_minimum.AAC.2
MKVSSDNAHEPHGQHGPRLAEHPSNPSNPNNPSNPKQITVSPDDADEPHGQHGPRLADGELLSVPVKRVTVVALHVGEPPQVGLQVRQVVARLRGERARAEGAHVAPGQRVRAARLHVCKWGGEGWIQGRRGWIQGRRGWTQGRRGWIQGRSRG